MHIVGPEQGFTLPGMTIVCGDSHTSTHGAFGALAHGIGTSEVEHVLATQTLIQRKPRTCGSRSTGTPPPGVTAKDIILAIIGEIGTAGGTGHVMEYAGEAIRGLSMEGRMTVCNMVDRRRRPCRPDRAGRDDLRLYRGSPARAEGCAVRCRPPYWETLYSEDGSHFDREVKLDASKLPPLVTWGTSRKRGDRGWQGAGPGEHLRSGQAPRGRAGA